MPGGGGMGAWTIKPTRSSLATQYDSRVPRGARLFLFLYEVPHLRFYLSLVVSRTSLQCSAVHAYYRGTSAFSLVDPVTLIAGACRNASSDSDVALQMRRRNDSTLCSAASSGLPSCMLIARRVLSSQR